MKMIIEFNEDEMISALADPFLMDLIYKIRRVSAKYMKEQNIIITEKVKPITKNLKEKEPKLTVKRKHTRRTDKISPVPEIRPHPTPSRDKICGYCLKSFRDDSKTNTRKWCSDECKVNAKEKEATFRSDKGQARNVPVAKDQPGPVEPSFYKKKLQEQAIAEREAAMIKNFREHPKIDWKKVKKIKFPQVP